ncbi:hypothetical protein B5X24_HaOG211346 [Helicoverpa armigera]|nr:hypothetical protein B5X24_HaOG211346 [Helicoverpa armigera]
MEVLRYKYIFIVVSLLLESVSNEESKTNSTGTTPNCPFSKIIDVFKIHNKTSDKDLYKRDEERVKLFLSTIANITNENISRKEEDLINIIIASINRIKNNISDTSDKLNEAIIVTSPKDSAGDKIKNQIKSGIEDKIDIYGNYNASKKHTTKSIENYEDPTTERPKYVEILTKDPHTKNTTSANIIEVLKHLMPLFNSTLTKEVHNITIIETDHSKNHSFSATKNVSTIIVTYCDNDNLTKVNKTSVAADKGDKKPDEEIDDYYDDEKDLEIDGGEGDLNNITIGEKKEIMEAADYGMQKMHELYTVLEPKLYSMGLWLDDSSPARYVAAFNAPSEEAAKFSRYGYASLQAATKLKQLISGGNGEGLEGREEETQFPTASMMRQSSLMQHCPLRGAPKCPPASKRYRTHDGTCNNINRPRWGSTMTPVQRFLAPSYSDGLQAARRSIFGTKLPSAREISSTIHEDRNAETVGVTHLLMQWGQFLDHDVTSSSQSRGFNGSVPRCCKDGGRDFVPKEFMHPECFPIPVPASDPFYGPRGVRCLDFVRSSPAPRDDCALGWREQLNQVSAYIDGSPLYGSSATKSDKLRLFRNGMLQYGRMQQRRPVLPPERRDELCRKGAVSTDCFKSGDARVNEHPGLVAAHIVWLRQHNRMAQELTHLNPHWSDEKIYQETRKIVGAMIQHITYREFLPIVLGSEVMHRFELELQKKGFYKGYNPKINPSPASSFGSAAFRFGHSLVQSSMVRFDRFHRPMSNNVSLHDELSNPSNIWSIGAVDRLLLGMLNQPIQKRDEFITEELTNHLFQTPQFDFGMDLAAINIQRGRDHGVPPYTSWREPCGLSAIEDFDDLLRVMPARAARKMKTLYRHVDDIDLFTAGMAERPVIGGLVGPTFACIIAQQFTNLRKGDRFWYENGGFESSFTPAQLQQIRRISFAQVLCRTLDSIDTVQPFVFLSTDNPDNDRISCQNGLLNNFDLSPWIEIDSESDNDISKAEATSPKPTKKPSTTPRTTTTKKTAGKGAIKPNKKKPDTNTSTIKNMTIESLTKENPTDKLNVTDLQKDNDKDELNLTLTNDMTTTVKPNITTKPIVTRRDVQIDDKLDFKNKSRRFDDVKVDSRRRPSNKYDEYEYDDEEDTQQVQSVVINNVAHKRPQYNRPNSRPNNRPVITVTENVDKYTYLINYVPRPTESWRQSNRRPTTGRPTSDRDVVKVTYQTYDDTYRRPNKPYYYNRQDNQETNYRYNRPTHTTKISYPSSARSNDETVTQKTKVTDKPETKSESTTDLYKLVTFGYVGTYKGSASTTEKKMTDITVTDKTVTDKKDIEADMTNKEVTDRHKAETVSKDFSTFDANDNKNMKLSTFYLYETATKPYLQRPTRRNDEVPVQTNKYYYIRNVLHKYSNTDKNPSGQPNKEEKREVITDGYNNVGDREVNMEERSAVDKMASLEDIEVKSNVPSRHKNRVKPSSPAKTPSVAFQVIPSENSPSQWAVYDENLDLPEQHNMPTIKTDPYALKEIPTPIAFNSFRRRRPGLGRH